MPDGEWKNVSMFAKDFIFKTIKKEPNERLTLDKALNHPWLKNN